jgi:hypothetical protein
MQFQKDNIRILKIMQENFTKKRGWIPDPEKFIPDPDPQH